MGLFLPPHGGIEDGDSKQLRTLFADWGTNKNNPVLWALAQKADDMDLPGSYPCPLGGQVKDRGKKIKIKVKGI